MTKFRRHWLMLAVAVCASLIASMELKEVYAAWSYWFTVAAGVGMFGTTIYLYVKGKSAGGLVLVHLCSLMAWSLAFALEEFGWLLWVVYFDASWDLHQYSLSPFLKSVQGAALAAYASSTYWEAFGPDEGRRVGLVAMDFATSWLVLGIFIALVGRAAM